VCARQSSDHSASGVTRRRPLAQAARQWRASDACDAASREAGGAEGSGAWTASDLDEEPDEESDDAPDVAEDEAEDEAEDAASAEEEGGEKAGALAAAVAEEEELALASTARGTKSLSRAHIEQIMPSFDS
jgi:hypothetical protein